jgi:hypothetical protein
VPGDAAAETIYVATITLTPADTNYTFTGTILADFEVAGVDEAKDDDGYTNGLKNEVSGDDVIITAIFPATEN